MAKDTFDSVPAGTMRSTKKGRIKPVPNPVLANLKNKSTQLANENSELKDRLAALEEAVLGLSKKGKK